MNLDFSILSTPTKNIRGQMATPGTLASVRFTTSPQTSPVQEKNGDN